MNIYITKSCKMQLMDSLSLLLQCARWFFINPNHIGVAFVMKVKAVSNRFFIFFFKVLLLFWSEHRPFLLIVVGVAKYAPPPNSSYG